MRRDRTGDLIDEDSDDDSTPAHRCDDGELDHAGRVIVCAVCRPALAERLRRQRARLTR